MPVPIEEPAEWADGALTLIPDADRLGDLLDHFADASELAVVAAGVLVRARPDSGAAAEILAFRVLVPWGRIAGLTWSV